MRVEEKHKTLFCFGYGYCAAHLGRALSDCGQWRIMGTTRDNDKKRAMKLDGIQTYVFDNDKPLDDVRYMLRNVTHILISTPPSDVGDPVFNIHAHELAALPNLEWVGYLSTTGSYGDRDGAWVDETTVPRPTTKRGSRRLKAEEQWLSLHHKNNIPVHIFRLAGIYGPGRSAIESVRSGIARRIDKPGHAFSRIHVDDITQVLQASIHSAQPGVVYNVCDDLPAPSHEVIAEACALIGMEPPPLMSFDEVDMAPITRSFYKDNKRVRNDKIKRELNVVLKYPSYREGLRDCFDSEEQYDL